MQLSLAIPKDRDLSQLRVMVSLSGGINSAAVLCYLCSEYPSKLKPKELFIYYSHLKEHSPDTGKFVCDQIRYAKKHFESVTWQIRRFSALNYFREKRWIPAPKVGSCSMDLKRIPAQEFRTQHQIDLDLVGYVREERNRRLRQQSYEDASTYHYPIAHLSDAECFLLVEREIGWYPEIYKHTIGGRRVFKHNNCLPCKNMRGNIRPKDGSATEEYMQVGQFYPKKLEKAIALSKELNRYWVGLKRTYQSASCVVLIRG